MCTQTHRTHTHNILFKYESDELEKSVYQDYDSDSDVPEELKQDYVDEQTGDAPLKRSVSGRSLLFYAVSPWVHSYGFTAKSYDGLYLENTPFDLSIFFPILAI